MAESVAVEWPQSGLCEASHNVTHADLLEIWNTSELCYLIYRDTQAWMKVQPLTKAALNGP